MCREKNLNYHVEEGNSGVVVINLGGAGGYQGQNAPQYQPGHQNHHQGHQQQQHHQQQQQQQQQDSSDDCAGLLIKAVTFCFKKFLS